MPRAPTRAFVNTAEPAKAAVKGSKIAEPPCPHHLRRDGYWHEICLRTGLGATSGMARSARWVAQNCQVWYPSDGACDRPRTRLAGLISPFGRACEYRSPQRGLPAEGTLGWMPSGRRRSGAAPGEFENDGKRIPLTVFLMRGVDAS
jgi:hypothetical protein